MSSCRLLWIAALLVLPSSLPAAEPIEVGFATVDVTPAIKPDRPVWIAGYGTGRQATGVHDPILCRCVVLFDGKTRIGLVSLDLIGLQFDDVLKIRRQVSELDYVLVSSTHNHEGPDVIGIWGRTLFKRGVDPAYVEKVRKQTVACLRQANERLTPVQAEFGTARDPSLVDDSRLPIVKDDVIRVVRFIDNDTGKDAGLIVQWSCHPEALGSRNTLLTADFPATTVKELRQRHDCPVVYFSGALGGLMAPPNKGVMDDEGNRLRDGSFEYAEAYGKKVADLADRAKTGATSISLSPIVVSPQRAMIPVSNPYYRLAGKLGVVKRPAYRWKGNFRERGEPVDLGGEEPNTATETEVAYLKLGQLHIAAIPGEIYPELVYGKYQDPVASNVDFPAAPLEPSVQEVLPSKQWMLLGLANDEIGYIIPRRQWDQLAPYAYDRTSAQYGEINSCGPDVAPLIMQALQAAVAAAKRD